MDDQEAPGVDNWPLWQFVSKHPKTREGGGNQKFACNICHASYSGSYSRVKSHLLKVSGFGIKGCPKVTVSQINDMLKLEDEACQRRDGRQKMVPLPRSFTSSSQSSSYSTSMDGNAMNSSSFNLDGYEAKKRKIGGDSPLQKSFNLHDREILDGEIARMFYSAGLPFNLARNPHYRRAFSFAAAKNLASYIPPGYNVLRTRLLEKEKTNVEDQLEATKSTWKTKGVTLVCDGWTDPQRRPLINFMVVNEGGMMFLRAVNCQGEYKDKWFISNLIKEVIVEVGAANVVQVITDNAPVCRAARLLIEQMYPHIFWTPCVVHTINLALKNICAAKNTEANEVTYDECHWITEVATTAVMIRNFINNHSMRLSMFNDFSKLKLLAVAETRFASVIIMLKRLKLIKKNLQAMVISEQWSCYREDDVAKARIVKEKLLGDLWWDSVDYILDFAEPIYEMLRVCDTDTPCLHLIHEMWDSMLSKVKEAIYKHEKKSDSEHSNFWSVVKKILEDRWSKSSTPLHCLAFSLNPRCTTKEWQSEHPNLLSPQSDLGISQMRKICLKRFFPDEDARRDVNIQLAKFFACTEDFADEDSIRDRWKLDPFTWWMVHGSGAPCLRSIGMRLLGQVSSSSCCERNWSTYAFIQSERRNKITPQRAQDLVFVHNNLRLLSRKTPQYKQGDTKMWDVAGDSFESMDDVGILEIAHLSLDEPDLESGLLVDDASGELGNDPPLMNLND